MSRGGRGGGVRGGHGGGGVGRGKIGADVPGYDPEVEKFLSWKPLEKFPLCGGGGLGIKSSRACIPAKIPELCGAVGEHAIQITPAYYTQDGAIRIPTAPRPNQVQKRQIAHYRTLRAQIHEGPLYTVLGNHMKDPKARRIPQAALFDPFKGTPTLSDKFRKKHRRIPKLDTRPYVLDFFPKELWSTLDPKFDASADPSDPTGKGKRKILKIGKSSGNILEELEKAERRFNLENPGPDDEDMDQEDIEDEDEDKMEEEQDTDYGEDEDENDDYNAEGYFSNGEDDHGEDGMGDYDDGGGGFYD